MRPEARGQRPDPNPDPGNQSEARTDRIPMYDLQKVKISAHLEPMQSGNTLVSMLRPCSSSAGKFEMDNENGSRWVLQKTSSIKETLK